MTTILDIRVPELCVASQQGEIEKVMMLLSTNPSCVYDTCTPSDNTALHLAACGNSTNHAKIMISLITAGAVIDCVNSDGNTPLNLACCFGYVPNVIILISSGAVIDNPCGFGQYTALHTACSNRNADTARLLIQNGADVERRTRFGSTPLDVACGCYGDSRKETVLELLKAGANPNVQDTTKGNTPLHSAVSQCDTDVLKALLDAGANVNTQDKYKRTALHIAVDYVYPEIVKLLLISGIDPEIQDQYGRKARDIAVNYGYPEIVELFS